MGRRLWQQADRDLRVAKKLFEPESYYAAANFAHQAAEKALKAAYWHLRAEEPPWKHNLVECADRVAERSGGLPGAVEAAVEQLQPMFEESRYPTGNVNDPIPADVITREDAQACLKSAEEVMVWVQTMLLQPHGRTRRKTNS